MHHFLYPLKDTTLYSDNPFQNSGKDEILEIIKMFNSASLQENVSTINSRIILQFDLNFISQSISRGEINNPKFYLNMFVCRTANTEEQPSLNIHPMSSSWIEGTGKRFDEKIRIVGSSWTASDGETPTFWTSSGGDYISATLITSSLWSNEQEYDISGKPLNGISDMRVDVSSIVYSWLSSSIANNGFMIKRSDEQEENSKSYGIIQFYSQQSHTIYSPKLEVMWVDYLHSTGSLSQLTSSDMVVFSKNLNEKYSNKSKIQIRVGSRKQYPEKSYVIANPYITNFYLPSSSYYSIIDISTNETVVPFDDYTQISCDYEGNYFNLWLHGFFPERNYKFKFNTFIY